MDAEKISNVIVQGPFHWRTAIVLDPVERSTEVVFGVLMAMSITGTLSVTTAGRQEVVSMTVGAIGCNIAWGLVDAAMYLMRALTNRRRQMRAWQCIRDARDAPTARRLIQLELPDHLELYASPQLLDSLHASMARLPLPPVSLLARDFSGAWGVFLLVVTSTFPVVVPFLLVHDSNLAMRLSNVAGVVTLFVAGLALGRFASGHPWRYGVAMSLLGVVLVGVIVALGG